MTDAVPRPTEKNGVRVHVDEWVDTGVLGCLVWTPGDSRVAGHSRVL